MFAILPPVIQYTDLDGTPLFNGSIYFGVINQNPETNPITVYWDEAGTQPAAQPIKTINGFPSRDGTPANLYANVNYSISVKNKSGKLVYSFGIATSSIFTAIANLATSVGSSLIGYIQSGIGAVVRTIQDRLREKISAADFMTDAQRADVFAGTATLDVSDAIQKAVNYCATFARWPALIIPGRCLIRNSVNIDRLVDTSLSDFLIIGRGTGAGFYTDNNTVIFDSTIAVTTDPKSEFIRFKDIHFETSSVFNQSYVLSKKFLRVSFECCRFALIRCILTPIYVQSMTFSKCNIRNNPASFINCIGLYDVVFDSGCVIENGNTLVRCIDVSRGCSGLRIYGNVIEGIQSSVVVATGLAGFVYSKNNCESNFSPEINAFGGGLQNKSIEISGNYIYNPGGATMYYGPTDKVTSFNNTCFPSVLHGNAIQVTDLVSMGDSCSGGISDCVNYSVVNGVYRAGNTQDAWTHSAKHFTKNVLGEFGMGWTPIAGTRFLIFGQDQSNTKFALSICDSAGNTIMAMRNDRAVTIPALANYANDAAAAVGGIPVGYMYRNGSVLMIRVV